MGERVSISNVVRVDSINNFRKATLVYKASGDSVCEISLRLAERGWLKQHPNRSVLDRLSYASGGMHYVADRCSSVDGLERTLTFFLPDGSVTFYSDGTNGTRFTHILNLLHSTHWGTLRVESDA